VTDTTTPPVTDPLAPAVPAAPTKAAGKVELTPDTSDVPPVYLAIVSKDDADAVMDVVALVPANKQSTVPTAFKRELGKWKPYPQIMDDLRSATPPPVVKLDDASLKSVLTQMDGATATTASASMDHVLMVLFGPDEGEMQLRAAEFLASQESLTAAGGADRNRGNAERLRRYWVHGEGAAKIRWGTPGDWSRCVRHLSKFLGVRAKGYCQLRHKDALGFYTATHAKMDHAKRHGLKASGGYEAPPVEYHDPQIAEYGKSNGQMVDYSKSMQFTEVTEQDMATPMSELMTYSDQYHDKAWKPSDEVAEAMREANKCNDAEFADFAACAYPMTAAGILDKIRSKIFDKNPKNAERLRLYWTTGKGGAKIRWNTGGDWKRCVRHLSKYLGPRAKGYCALRHKEMTGMWTGDALHRKMYGWGKHQALAAESDVRSSMDILSAAELSARAEKARVRLGLTAAAGALDTGAAFVIPLVIPEEVESGDGRIFKKDALTSREFPLPLMWQMKTAEGHMGSVVVGRIDSIDRVDGGLGNARGVFDTGEYGKEAERMVRHGFLRGVSADLDKFEAEEPKPKELSDEEAAKGKKLKNDKLVIDKARVMAVTIVPKPAFQECSIVLAEDLNTNNQEDTMIPNGVYVDDVDSADAQALVACGMIAGAIPLEPPTEWFNDPKLDRPTPLTVTDDGRVFGHIAAWHVDHIGLAFGTRPPRSKSNYGYFHTGVLRTADGADVPVGQLTLAGGHAGLEASAAEAAKHYDDTGSAFADVHAGEDKHGIWVSGALRPGTTPEQVRAIRASAPSGDWRPIKGALELVAVCQVNVPGFPIARARVASGQVMALVAAGASTLAKLKSDPLTELSARMERLERLAVTSVPVLVERKQELSARVREAASLSAIQQYDDQFAMFSPERRKKLADKGQALPDGSFPIVTVNDLKNAIKSYGLAKNKAAAKKHIIKRAAALKKSNLIPQEWHGASSEALTASVESMRERIAKLEAGKSKTAE